MGRLPGRPSACHMLQKDLISLAGAYVLYRWILSRPPASYQITPKCKGKIYRYIHCSAYARTLVKGTARGDERSEALPLPPVPLPAVHGPVGIAVLSRPMLLLVQQVSLVHLKNEGIVEERG